MYDPLNTEDSPFDWGPGTENSSTGELVARPMTPEEMAKKPTMEDWLASTTIGWNREGKEARKFFNREEGKECWHTLLFLPSGDIPVQEMFGAYRVKPDLVENRQGGVKTLDGKKAIILGSVPESSKHDIFPAWIARNVGGRVWTDLVHVPLEK